jgi:hypothetical protein
MYSISICRYVKMSRRGPLGLKIMHEYGSLHFHSWHTHTHSRPAVQKFVTDNHEFPERLLILEMVCCEPHIFIITRLPLQHIVRNGSIPRLT